MRQKLALTLLCCALAPVALAQNPPSAEEETTPPQTTQAPAVAPPAAQGAREVPPDTDPFDVRVQRRIDEFGQRHQERENKIASYDKASGDDPGLGRFADPRKAQVELSDELDRERTSQELANDYAEQARAVETREQALREFIARRKKALDDLTAKQAGAAHRQDLEVALANLARLPDSPETQAKMREIDQRLSESEFDEKQLPAQQKQIQQESADAAEVLAKLEVLVQSYQKEAKAFSADALSARQNRVRLADKIEYFLVRAQADDELEQGRKAIDAVQHLPASPELEKTLNGGRSSARPPADLQQLKECIQQSGDVRACREKVRPQHQE